MIKQIKLYNTVKFWVIALFFIGMTNSLLFSATVLTPVEVGPTVDLVVSTARCVNPTKVENPYTFNSVTITNGGSFELCVDSTSPSDGLFIHTNTTFDIQVGGQVNVKGRLNYTGGARDAVCTPTWVVDANWTGGIEKMSNSPDPTGGATKSPYVVIPGPLSLTNLTSTYSRYGTNGDTSPVGLSGPLRGGAGGYGGLSMCNGDAGKQPQSGAGPALGAFGKAGAMFYVEADTFINSGTVYTNGAAGGPGASISRPSQRNGQNTNDSGVSGYQTWSGNSLHGSGGGGGGPIIIKARQITSNATGSYDSQGGLGGAGGGYASTARESNISGGWGGRGQDGPVILIYATTTSTFNSNFMSRIYIGSTTNLGATRFYQELDNTPPIINGLNFEGIFRSDQKKGIWINLKGLTAISNAPAWSTVTLQTAHWVKLYDVRVNSFNIADYVKKNPIDEVWFQFSDDVANTRYYFCLNDTDCNTTSPSSKMDPLVAGEYLNGYYNVGQTAKFNWYNDWFLPGPTGGTGEMYGNKVLPFFTLPDGVNYLKVFARTRGDIESVREEAIFIDQYAPCDNINHLCFVKVLDTANNDKELNIAGLSVKTASMNSYDFKLRLTFLEGGGSGVESNPPYDNISILVARQSGTVLQSMSGNIELSNAALLRDKTCDELTQVGAAWDPIKNDFRNFSYVYSDTDQGFVIDSATNGFGLRSDVQSLLTASSGDGTIYFITCVTDKAGNNSRIIIPSDTDFFATAPATYSGAALPATLADYDITQANRDHPTNFVSAFSPRLVKRVFFDTSVKDDNPITMQPCPVNVDPCLADVLSPQPAFKPEATPQYIAYNPPNFTNGSKIEVGIKLPFDKSGIKTVYYYIGTSTPSQTDAIPVTNPISCSTVVNANNAYDTGSRPADWVDFCFTVTAATDNSIYVWFEDNSGNIGTPSAYNIRTLLVDNTDPSAPQNVYIDSNPTTSLTPLVKFVKSTDSNGIEEYITCYWQSIVEFTHTVLTAMQVSPLDVICPGPAQLFGKKGYKFQGIPHIGTGEQKFQIPVAPALEFGRWDIAVFARDTAGNVSIASPVYQLILSDGKSYVDFTAESEDYTLGGVHPRTGSKGAYTFKIRYTDLENNAPITNQIWIDLDGDGKYGFLEKLTMSKDLNTPKVSDRNDYYWDGEAYKIDLNLEYLIATEGKIRYKFLFANPLAGSVDGPDEGDPASDNYITLDPYDINSFHGMIQIRNNVAKPTSKKNPVIIMKEPLGKDKSVNLAVYNTSGVLVKVLVNGSPYNQIDRFVVWDLKDRTNVLVDTGLYYVVYEFDNGERETSKIIVIR